MLFGKKTVVESKEINHAYERFRNDTRIILLCADELRDFDERHIVEAQCFPLRVVSYRASVELDKKCIYYVYALKEGTAYEATKRLVKQGFRAYNLGSLVNFKGPEEGLHVKNRKKNHKGSKS